jgi:hypothetical protein
MPAWFKRQPMVAQFLWFMLALAVLKLALGI